MLTVLKIFQRFGESEDGLMGSQREATKRDWGNQRDAWHEKKGTVEVRKILAVSGFLGPTSRRDEVLKETALNQSGENNDRVELRGQEESGGRLSPAI